MAMSSSSYLPAFAATKRWLRAATGLSLAVETAAANILLVVQSEGYDNGVKRMHKCESALGYVLFMPRPQGMPSCLLWLLLHAGAFHCPLSIPRTAHGLRALQLESLAPRHTVTQLAVLIEIIS